MKNINYFTILLIVIFAMSTQAQNSSDLKNVVEKGKSDLIEILSKTKENFNFGIDQKEVRNSNSEVAISNYEMNFEKLLKYQQEQDGLMYETENLTVPLLNDGKVVTTLGVTKDEKQGYKITKLINHSYQHELNQLPAAVKNRNFSKIKIVNVPNLNTNIYMDNDMSYTSYKNHNLQEAIPTETLLKELKEDAIKFQKEYGHLLKDNKLVK